MLAHDRPVGSACGLQTFSAALGEAGIGASGVVLASAAAEQLVSLEAVYQTGEAAARELGVLGQVAHAHPAGGSVHQMLEDLIGAELQPMLALKSALQALCQRGVRTQQTAPGAKLGLAERVLLPRPCSSSGASLRTVAVAVAVDMMAIDTSYVLNRT